jgi:lysozyme
MVAPYQISSEMIAQIKLLEGFQPRATALADGRWAVGYGHVASTQKGSVVTRTQAELLLRYDLTMIEQALAGLVFTPLNANQIDALGSFVYNIGLEAFEGSDVLKRVNAGDLIGAASAMERWCHALVGGKSQELDGLIRRRAMEKALFLTPPEGWVPVPSRLVVPHADAPNMCQDSTAEVVAEASAPIEGPQGASPEIEEPFEAASLLEPESDLDSSVEPSHEPAPLFPATASVARRAVKAKSAVIGRIDPGRVATLVLMAVAGLAAMGFAFNLGFEADHQNAQRLARIWAIGTIGLLTLCATVALMLRALNARS